MFLIYVAGGTTTLFVNSNNLAFCAFVHKYSFTSISFIIMILQRCPLSYSSHMCSRSFLDWICAYKWINIGRKCKYIGKYSVGRLPTSPLICQLSAGWRRVRVRDVVSAVSPHCRLCECCLIWRTVLITFSRFSIWSFYHKLKGSFELWFYLCKKSVCQMVIEISGVKVACAFFHKEIKTREAVGRFHGRLLGLTKRVVVPPAT